MNLLERAVLATLPAIPRPLMRRLSARYIAGETIEEALAKLESLQGRGFPGVLDILGEDVADEAEAREVLGTYQAAATAAAERGLDSYVSIKPTHFGLRISRDLCEELYDQLLAHCATIGVFARVEMEDHSTTDDTLAIFHSLRSRHDNVGIVLQSRLFRTPDDVAALPEECDVRMVKGIYLEPAEIVSRTRENTARLFPHAGAWPPVRAVSSGAAWASWPSITVGWSTCSTCRRRPSGPRPGYNPPWCG